MEIINGAKDELGTAKLPLVDCTANSFQTQNTKNSRSITVYTERTGYAIMYTRNTGYIVKCTGSPGSVTVHTESPGV